jgi:hypothetical protein
MVSRPGAPGLRYAQLGAETQRKDEKLCLATEITEGTERSKKLKGKRKKA